MRVFLLLAATGLVVLAQRSEAYQTDVHYGLTYWLAKNAGFASWQSHEIARENQKADVGDLDAVHAITARVCFGFDSAAAENASQLVRDLHFRSSEAVPAPAKTRAVRPDPKGFAAKEVERLLRDDATPIQERLYRMGRALHGWQDAFSHAGVSDESSPCAWLRPSLAWSHPKDRGGWWRTKADLTFEDTASCISAGLSTFDYLVRLRDLLKIAPGPRSRGDIGSRLVAFCGARTQSAKAKWFNAEGVPQPSAIVGHTTLDVGEEGRVFGGALNLSKIEVGREVEPVDRPWYDLPTSQRESDRPVIPPALATLPSTIVLQGTVETEWVDRFLTEWLAAAATDMRGLSDKYFDLARKWGDVLFRWKLIDRGRAESPASPDLKAAIVRDGLIEKALVPVRGQPKQPFLVLPEPSNREEFLVLFILRHAPYQTVAMRVRKTEKGYRVIAFEGVSLM